MLFWEIALRPFVPLHLKYHFVNSSIIIGNFVIFLVHITLNPNNHHFKKSTLAHDLWIILNISLLHLFLIFSSAISNTISIVWLHWNALKNVHGVIKLTTINAFTLQHYVFKLNYYVIYASSSKQKTFFRAKTDILKNFCDVSVSEIMLSSFMLWCVHKDQWI